MERLDPDRIVGRRLQPRVVARLYAQLVTCEQLQTVYIESLSTSGAGLSLDTVPPVGAEVVLSWQEWDWPCVVIWSHGRHCGLSFATPIAAEVVDALRRSATRQRTVRSGRYVRDLPGRASRTRFS
jgi:hypothetical protein